LTGYGSCRIIPDQKKLAAPIRSFHVLSDSSVIIGTVGDGAIKISNNGVRKNLTSYNDEYQYHYVFQYSDEKYYGYSILRKGKTKTGISLKINGDVIFTRQIQKGEIKNTFYIKRRNNHVVFTACGTSLELFNNQITDSLKEPSDILSLYEDSDSCLWVGYFDGGVKRIAPNEPLSSKNYKLYFLHNQVTKVQEDYEHGFWFATLNNGIIYVPNIKTENLEYSGEIYDREKTVNITSDHRSKLFIGTNKGTLKIFGNGLKLKELHTTNYIKTLYYDTTESKLYISGHSNLYSYDGNKLEELKNGGVLCFLKDTNDSLLAGSYNGIMSYFPKRKRPELLCKNEIVRVETMCIDENNTLWIGSFNGLYYREDNQIKKKTGDPLLNCRISSLFSKGNSLYIGTIEKGLLKLQEKRIESFTIKQGLPSNIVNSILNINDSILWIATAKGACKFNMRTQKAMFTIDSRKGLLSNEVKGLELLNDTLYILTNEGVSFFKAGQNFNNSTPPAVYIQDVRVDTVSYINEIEPTLNHSMNYITFNVTGLTYKQSGSVLYKYRLKGYSEQWKTTSSNNIQLAFVPPGSYTFEVVAENEDGVESLKAATLAFTISQPFWKQLWFQLIAILSILIIIVLVFYARLKSIREKNKIMEQLGNYKQQALTMQMNPHFIFNLLSSIQSYVLSENSLKASKYLSMFAKLMRKSLDQSRKEFVSLEEEVEILNLYIELEKTRLKKELDFYIEWNQDELSNFQIPPMLIQPHLENAIKHGITNADKHNKIQLSFVLKGKLLYCTIEDDGIGIEESMAVKKIKKTLHTSAALDITKTRLELLCRNYNLPFTFSIKDRKHSNAKKTGTIVEFLIPYMYEPESVDS
jgi:hypothetical protein